MAALPHGGAFVSDGIDRGDGGVERDLGQEAGGGDHVPHEVDAVAPVDRGAVPPGGARQIEGSGLVGEDQVSVNSGVHAARLALEARRRQVFPAAWPSVELTPARRMAVLAAALHGTTTDSAPSSRDWAVEPVDETGPGYRITTKGGFVFGASMDGGRLTALASPPRWLPFRGVINRLAAAATLRLHARRR